MPIDVSVIIPTFRRPDLLVEAINSVFAQEQVTVEVTVIDDCPEGSAACAIERIGDARIQYLKSSTPSGGNPAFVRNQGWQHASGRYVHFLDDDDVLAAGAYRAMIDALDKKPNLGVVLGRIEPFGNDPKQLAIEQAYFANAEKRAKLSRCAGRWLMTSNLLFMDTLLVNSACILRRECIEPLGGYDKDIRLVEDVDFYHRAIRRFGCVYLDRVVLHYRTGAPSLMHDRVGTAQLVSAYNRMHAKYKSEHGTLEFMILKLLARTALTWI